MPSWGMHYGVSDVWGKLISVLFFGSLIHISIFLLRRLLHIPSSLPMTQNRTLIFKCAAQCS